MSDLIHGLTSVEVAELTKRAIAAKDVAYCRCLCTVAAAVVKLHGSFLGSHVDISPSEPRSVLKLPGRLRSALR